MAIFKNKFLLSVIILLSFFTFSNTVSAYTAVGDDCTASGECLLVCNYVNRLRVSNSDMNRSISIYYYFGKNYWQVKWQTTTTSIYTKEPKMGNFSNAFSDNVYLTTDVAYDTFECPKYGFLDLSYLNSDNEVCFDNDGKTCAEDYSNMGTAFGNASDKFVSSQKDYDIFSDIDRYFDEWVLGDISCDELAANADNINNGSYFSQKMNNDISINFFKGNEVPVFLNNYIDKISETIYTKFSTDLDEKIAICNSEIDTAVENGELDSSVADQQKNAINSINKEAAMQQFKNYVEEMAEYNSDIIEYESLDCEGILGDPDNDQEPAYWIQFVLDIMKYIAIAALLVLSTIEFLKAIVSNDKDALKKAGKTTGLRFVYCIILFFLPILVNFIMSLLGIYDTCGIG